MFNEEKYSDRPILGLIETVTCKSKNKKATVHARIDTGATKSSIDQALVDKLNLGPVLGERTIKNAHGYGTRKLIEVTIIIAGIEITEMFTIADRAHLKFPVLVGRNILRKGFLIDPNKKAKKLVKK